MTVSRCIVLMRNTLNNCCREKQNKHFMFNTFFFESSPVYETVSKNVVWSEATDGNTAGRCMLDQ